MHAPFKNLCLPPSFKPQHIKHTAMPRLILSEGNEQMSSTTKLFGRQRPLHEILGAGKVADILLWRNHSLSTSILIGCTVIWWLFEVAEYHLITLLSHICIAVMLAMFIRCNSSILLKIEPPKIPRFDLPERAKEVALALEDKFEWFMSSFYDLACGKNLKLFLWAIASLWTVSVIGSYCSSLSLLYFGILLILTLPTLYERYEDEVDHLARQGILDLKKLYKMFETEVLNKIPKKPVE